MTDVCIDSSKRESFACCTLTNDGHEVRHIDECCTRWDGDADWGEGAAGAVGVSGEVGVSGKVMTLGMGFWEMESEG